MWIQMGANSVEGVEATLYQMGSSLDSLSPFGMMPAQCKSFLNSPGQVWQAQQLAGKLAGIFFSTGSQGGSQETTVSTAITQLVNQALVYVPIGYTFSAGMFNMNEIKGGSPYGAGTFADPDGSRQPSKLKLETAFIRASTLPALERSGKKEVFE